MAKITPNPQLQMDMSLALSLLATKKSMMLPTELWISI
jgi:hypothetical protein